MRPQAGRAIARTKRGHRERLRRCLIFAGAENLPDTEILEVILFTANPRADAKPLVADLIECFGSLADVLSADAEALAAVGLDPPAIAGVKLVRGGSAPVDASRVAGTAGDRCVGQARRLLQRSNRLQQG